MTNVPQFLRETKNGDCLTTKYGDIILVQRVEITEKSVCVYPYFDYDQKERQLSMNEWLYGFYGPKFDDENFYRPSTDEEKELLIGEIKKRGYQWDSRFYGGQPVMTPEEFHRIQKQMGKCDECNECNE